MNKMNKKGFTLIEMLVVIAIIAILVAIIIPVVTAATEKANESRDAANIRAAIAEVSAKGLSEGTNQSKEVTLKQTGKFDKAFKTGDKIGEFDVSVFESKTSVTISYDATTGAVSVN